MTLLEQATFEQDEIIAMELYEQQYPHMQKGYMLDAADDLRQAIAEAEACQCPACRAGTIHDSDCAVHNMPAAPNGPCDCRCRKCGGTMSPSKAMGQTWSGRPEWAGDVQVTMSPGGPGKLIDCLKCSTCGHSVYAGQHPQAAINHFADDSVWEPGQEFK